MTNKRSSILWSAILLFALVTVARAEISDLHSAVNKAGAQRMLSQRIAKLYFQIGQNVDTERSKRLLDSSLFLFDRNLVELKNYAPGSVRETYHKLERAWLAYKDLLLGSAPSASNARKVMALSDEVLSLAHQGTLQLERQGAGGGVRLVNIAGRQRMLSQRMAKFYQAGMWNIVGSAEEIEQARREFNDGLREMDTTAASNSAIRQELDLAKQQWFFFENALKARGGEARLLATTVATTSERLLETMETVTSLYEKNAK